MMMRSYIYLLAFQLIVAAAFPFLEREMPARGAIAPRTAVHEIGGPRVRIVELSPPPVDSSDVSANSADTVQVQIVGDTIDFGDVYVGTRRDTLIGIRKFGPGQSSVAFNILQGGANGRFQEPSGPVTIQDSISQMSVTFSFAPDSVGLFRGSVQVTSDGLDRIINLKGRGIDGGTLLDRDTIDFGAIDLATTQCAQRVDTLVDTLPVSVTASLDVITGRSVFSMVDSVRNRVITGRGGTLFFQSSFCPPDTGTFFGQLVITSSSGTERVVLRGRANRTTVTTPGTDSLVVDLPDIDFNDVPVDSCGRRTVVVRNDSHDTLRVVHSLPTGGSFNWQNRKGDTIVLAPDSSDSITFVYCPRGMGAQEIVDSLRDSKGRYVATVRLHGRGADGVLTMQDTVAFTVQGSGCQTQPLFLRNDGNVPIAFSRLALAPPFSFVSPVPDPITLNAGDTLTLFIQFCDSSAGSQQQPLHFSYNVLASTIFSHADSLLLAGTVTGAPLKPLTTSVQFLDFGAVQAGQCKSDSFQVTNPNDSAIKLDASSIIPGGAGPSPFAISLPASIPATISAHNSITVVIRYCPDTSAADTAAWSGTGLARALLVDLYGRRVTETPSTGVRAWIDSNLQAAVGTPFRLAVHIDPDPGDTSGMAWDSVRISFNPRSLFPRAAYSPGVTAALPLRRIGHDAIIVARAQSVHGLQSGPLFELEMMGLTTGVPANTVSIDTMYFTGVPRTQVVGSGYVQLSGCDLNGSISFSKAASIRSISQQSGSNQLALVFRAPQGAAPRLSIINVDGREIEGRILPPATGDDQFTAIDLAGIAPGFYLVELRIGNDRSTTQIMITK